MLANLRDLVLAEFRANNGSLTGLPNRPRPWPRHSGSRTDASVDGRGAPRRAGAGRSVRRDQVFAERDPAGGCDVSSGDYTNCCSRLQHPYP